MSDTLTPQPANGSAGVPYFTLPLSLPQWAPAAPLRTRKIAILGFGETVKDCPWQDPTWELWGMNGFWRAAEADFGITAPEDRYTLWFDMHSLAYTREYGKQAGFGDKQERWLEQPHPFRIFMLEDAPAFPSVDRFPIEDVSEELGRDYFTSTVAYALAYALTLPDVAEIGLWGIDLTHNSEYADQRPCAEYWAGRIEAAGIKLAIHEKSAMLRQRQRYGYEPENPMLGELRAVLQRQVAGLTEAIQKNQANADAIKAQMHTDDGALQTCRGLLDRLDVWERGGRI